MDKQLVEEMAKDLKTAGLFAMDWLCAETKQIVKEHGLFNSVNHTKSMYEIMAEELIKKNYCKIPEGAVVLTKEEHKQMLKDLIESNEKAKEIASKETAEKFAERVKMAFYYHFDELIPSIMAKDIDEILKEITEGK